MAFRPEKIKVDAYKVLGVQQGDNQDKIKKAYRKLALKYHPDKTQGDKAAEEEFKKAAEAYEAIGSDENKRVYDSYKATGQGSSASSSASGQYTDQQWEDFFNSKFGKGRGSSSYKNHASPKDEAAKRQGNVAKGTTITLDEDTIIVGDIEDGVTIIAKNARVKVEGNIGSNVTILQEEDFTRNINHTLYTGIEITGSIKNGGNFEAALSFKAKDIGNYNKINARSITAEKLGSDNVVTATGNDGIVVKNIGERNLFKSQGKVNFVNSGDGLEVEAYLSVKGSDIGNRCKIKGHSIELGDLGEEADLVSNNKIQFGNAGKKLVVNTDGAIVGKNISENNKIKGSSVTLENIGNDNEIISTSLDVNLKEVGERNKIVSGRQVNFENGSDNLQIEADLGVKGKNIGNHSFIKGHSVTLENIGNDNEVNSTGSNINLKRVGERNKVVSKGQMNFENSGDDLQVEAYLGVKGSDIGKRCKIKGHSIELGNLGEEADLSSRNKIQFNNANKKLVVNTDGAVVGKNISDNNKITGSSVTLENIGNDNEITSTSAGVDLKELGERNKITSSKQVSFENSGDDLQIEAYLSVKGKNIGNHGMIKGHSVVLDNIGLNLADETDPETLEKNQSKISAGNSVTIKGSAIDCLIEAGSSITVSTALKSHLITKSSINVDFSDNVSMFESPRKNIKNILTEALAC